MKPAATAAIAIGFVALVAGVVFLGPTLVDAVAGAPAVPPPRPIAPVARPAPELPPAPAPPVVTEPPSPPPSTPPPAPPPEPKPKKAEPVGYLSLSTVPPGIAVLHKGTQIGKTPLKHHALPVGKQAVALELKGQRKNLMLTVREGKEQKLNLQWAKLK